MTYDEDDYTGFSTASDDQDSTIPCPHCGKEVYDDSEQCPACGRYLSQEDSPPTSRTWWILICVAICVLIVILWMLGG